MACKDCTIIDFNTSPPKSLQDSRSVGLAIAGVVGGAAMLLSAICAPFVSPALRRICIQYVPATTQQIENIFTGLKGRSGTLIDLGSGDGRIVIEAAKRGFKAHGVELNPWLVWFSRVNAIFHGVHPNVSFQRKDIWKTSLGKYENVVIFGVDSMMKELNKKCQNEIKMDGAIAACRFSMPERKSDRVVGHGIDTVWIYFNNGQNKV